MSWPIPVFTKIIGHVGHLRWLGPNVWWDISQIWIEYIKPIGHMSHEPWKFFGYTAILIRHNLTSNQGSLCQKLLSSLAIWASGKHWSTGPNQFFLLAQIIDITLCPQNFHLPLPLPLDSSRALFTSPIGNWLANGVVPVLISQTVKASEILTFYVLPWYAPSVFMSVCTSVCPLK